MDQAYHLLRAQCVYCYRLRLSRNDLHRYACMLRLLQYGLIREAQTIDAIGHDYFSMSAAGMPEEEVQDSDSDADDASGDAIVRARDRYVHAVLQAHKINRGNTRRERKHEGVSETRRELVKALLYDMSKARVCSSCSGISPVYRRDRYVKIFERTLTPKEKAKMMAKNMRQRDALLVDRQAKKNIDEDASDEGVADMDLSDESAGDEDEGEGDQLDENGNVIMTDVGAVPEKAKAVSKSQRYISAMEVSTRLELLFKKEQDIMSLLYSSEAVGRKSQPLSADMFFLHTVLVPPNRYRPEARMGEAQVAESPQNNLYKMILRSSAKVAQISRELSGLTSSERNASQVQRPARDIMALHEAWTELQDSVNSLIDRSKNPIQGAAEKRNEDGIKQKLEKKEGLFRKNLMGKRVNYAARSVISPDPNIDTNEIGVPIVFAKTLTYPEPVTGHNFKDMQQAVINGLENWPGASAIENENGQVVNLRNKSVEERISLANQLLASSSSDFSGTRNKKVYRHLTNGDVVLMNRQPTLHKPSVMGHRVRVLAGEKTLRMHYANTNTYNADFDGDEMNMHFPQNEIARAEALQLADTDHQYISGTQGKPLRGLIQDHISVSVALCSKDSFFRRDAYQQLVYNALQQSDRIELVPPAIVKPVPRWTGKQIVTTILKNIKPLDCGELWMNGRSSTKGAMWGVHIEEGQVMFRDGEFVTGILDKAHLGPSSGGLIHVVHEVYGPAIAGKLLSSMGRLLTRYLNERAFTCGMDDIKLTAHGDAARREKLKDVNSVGLEVAAKYVTLDDRQPDKSDPELLRRLEEVMRDKSKQEGLDILMNKECHGISSGATSACLPVGLEKQFPKNHMQSMTTSGAKGSSVNANLISCNLGQQVLEGRRVPLMVSGKSLPSFKPYDTDARAGGFIADRFLTGLRPQEYYFHHMAGREGLIDTAVKTSRSGYLQRCLTKGMEGLQVTYDTSVRDSDGSIVQFLYGEDGLDITKQTYLKDFAFLLHNYESVLTQTRYTDLVAGGVFEHRDKVVKQMKHAITSAGRHPSSSARDPVASYLDQSRFAFSTSENFFKAMSTYTKTNPDRLVKKKGSDQDRFHQGALGRKTAEKILVGRYMRSLVEAGEAVGIVAGQSVGEPSTQMTLNTFHLAGHSAKNVTLGIPRLREILMTASASISTPSMTLILNEELSRADGETFAKAISVLPLSHVVDRISVREQVGIGKVYPLAKIYQVRLRFFPSVEYTKMYAVKIADVLDTIERKFIPALRRLIAKEIKKTGNNSAASPEIGVRSGVVEMAPVNAGSSGEGQGDDDDDDDDGDDGATSAKQKANRLEAVSYGPNDDEDNAIQRDMQRDASPFDGGSPEPGGPRDEDESADLLAGESEETSSTSSKSREARIKDLDNNVSEFRCDETRGEWCELTLEFDASMPKILLLELVQEAVTRSLVQQIPDIKQCIFDENAETEDPRTGEMTKVPAIHTVGTNLKAMQQYGDYINPNRISTNDIAAILEVYGVEACRNSIVQELQGVFGSHGISVDLRHLNLISDYMTRNGGFTPFNRMGLRGNVSPFTKMSFETTLAFLKDAILDGDWDELDTPSARLVMGKLGRIGTGSFDVLTRVPTHQLKAVYA